MGYNILSTVQHDNVQVTSKSKHVNIVNKTLAINTNRIIKKLTYCAFFFLLILKQIHTGSLSQFELLKMHTKFLYIVFQSIA